MVVKLRWRCSCPICRVFVHPILRNLGGVGSDVGQVERGGKSKKVEAKEGRDVIELSREVKGVEELKEIKPPPEARELRSSSEDTSINIGGGISHNEGRVDVKAPSATNVKVELPPEVMGKISELEEELGKVKELVKRGFDDLVGALVDLKSSILDLKNPLSLIGSPKSSPTNADIRDLDVIVKWVNKALDVLDINTLFTLIDGCTRVGLIDSSLGEVVKVLANVINELRSSGVGINDQLRIVKELISNLRSDRNA